LTIIGHPRIDLTITSSVPVAFASVKLCDVFPDGTSALVTRGILNLTHRGSHETPEPLVP
jgi:predicted acyl esterase